MAKLGNRIKVGTVTTGTGTVALGSGVTKFQSFDQGGIANGDVVSYVIETDTDWEIGRGTYDNTGPYLERTTVLKSSANGAAINLTGNSIVAATPLAEDFNYINGLASNTSSIYVAGGNGLSVNSIGVHVIGGTGIVSNTSGVHIANTVALKTDLAIDLTDVVYSTNTTITSAVAGKIIVGNTGANAITLTFANAASLGASLYVVKGLGSNTTTISTAAGETYDDGSSTVTLNPTQSAAFYSNGTKIRALFNDAFQTVVTESFTTNGTTGPYNLSNAPLTKAACWFSIGGVVQAPADWSLSGSQVTLGGSLPSGLDATITYITSPVKNMAITSEYAIHTGNNSPGPYDLLRAPLNAASVDIFVDGIFQPKDGTSYTTSNATITFSESVSNTTTWEERHFSTATVTIGTPDDSSVGSNSINVLQSNAILAVLGGASNTYVTSQLDTKAANTYVNTLLATTHATKTAIPNAANLNTYTTTGLYEQRNNAQAAAGTNYPTPFAGLLTVTSVDGTFIWQTYHQYNSGGAGSAYASKLWLRSFYTSWSSWTEVSSWGMTSRVFTGTTDTLLATDMGKAVRSSNNSAVTITIPLNSTIGYAVDTVINIEQYGTGQITISPAGGVTLRSSGSRTKLYGQYSVASLHKIGTDEWLLFGDIA